MEYDIKDIGLAEQGKNRIEWARQTMPVLAQIEQRFIKELPLKGMKIGVCLHVTTETAGLLQVMQAGGAELIVCASNPLSTQDDVAASLVKHNNIPVFAIKGEDNETYYRHISAVIDAAPNYTIDDGADLVTVLHTERREMLDNVLGGAEETTTGVIRLQSMAKEGVLMYPIIAVNDAATKHFFDNRYGTGQSTIDGIIRATNRLLAGTVFVVAGYGWCGRGLAMRARGMGARVVVTEVEAIPALEAIMDGFDVMPMLDAAKIGDFFCTVTGNIAVIRKEHFEAMKDGAIVCNSGHFNVELALDQLEEITVAKREIRAFVEEYKLADGRCINILAGGRLVNLSSAEGHPSSVMDMSFANHALSMEYLAKKGQSLTKNVYKVPESIDKMIAAEKLMALGVKVDTLTEQQKTYLDSWQSGTI